MKKQVRVTILFTLVFSMILQLIYIRPISAAKESDSVTILFTHDLHGNFLPFKEEKGGNVQLLGGYARLQSAILAEKAIDNEALLLDGGDYSMGTPFQTIFESTSPELRLMGRMGYDVVTLGNHEFDYRAEGLAASLKSAVESGDPLPQMVQGNTSFPTDIEGNMTASLTALKQAMEGYGVKEYTVLTRRGVKIGIFGIMGKEAADYAPMSEVVFEDKIKHAKRIVKTLTEQEQVDLIICLSHTGTSENQKSSEDEKLAKEVPEIDVIISGHSHTKLSEPIVIGNTVIGSGEEYGKNLGVIKLSQRDDSSWEPVRYELIPIESSLTENEEVEALISEYKQVVQTEYFDKFNLQYDEVIAVSPFNFPTQDETEDNHAESALGNLISDAYLYAVKQAEGENYVPVDVTIVPSGTIRGSFFQGEITTADAFSVSSLGIGADKMPGYPLICVYLTGKELKTIAEVDASVTPIMSEAQLFVHGLKYSFNPNRLIFNKVTDCSLVRPRKLTDPISEDNLENIEEDRLYRVVAGLYSAQMLSVVGEKSFGLLKLEPKTKDGDPVTDFEAQIIYSTEGNSKTELKEWAALVSYMKSFEPVNGVPTVPQYYNEYQGRKVVDDNKNILARLSQPNLIALIVYGIVLLLTAVLILLVRLIIRRIKRRLGSGRI